MAKQRAVIEKIKKLMMLSDMEKNNNINEALNAACKAQELINKHRLSYEKIMFESNGLNTSDHNFIDYIKHFETYFGGALDLPDWNKALIKIIADHNNCKSYTCKVLVYNKETKSNKEHVAVSIVGSEEDVLMVEELYFYLELEISKMCIMELAKQDAAYDKQWRSDFCLGAVAQLKEKFEALQSQQSGEALEENRGAIMRLSKKSEDLERFFSERKIKNQAAAKAVNVFSFSRGYRAAEKISIQIDKVNMLKI